MNHDFVRIPREGYRCTVCGWFWRNKSHTTCPGVKRYEWGKAPDNLKTEAQLRKLKLKPPDNPKYPGIGVHLHDGYVQYNEKISHWLYDVNEAIPLTEEELAHDKQKAKEARERRKARDKEFVK